MIRRSSHSLWGNMDFLAVTGSGSWSRWANRSGVRSSGLSGTTTTEASSARKTIRTSSNSNSSDSITSSGIRLIRANQVRGRNLPLFSGSQKVVVPASHVPEELINQVQVRCNIDIYLKQSLTRVCTIRTFFKEKRGQ